jgi:FkbM family methyltransferase
MIINKDYILSHILLLIEENRQQEQENEERANNFLRRNWQKIKFRIPEKIRIPYENMYKKYREYKYQNKKNMLYWPSLWMDKNFVRYCLEHEINLDTSLYDSPETEEYIHKHIDDRLRLALRGYIIRPMNRMELDYRQLEKKFLKNVRKVAGFLEFTCENKLYYIAGKLFLPNLWIYHYGLKELPDTVKSYIAGKDFLDVGAFSGDSALMLLNYSPHRIFAYEPVLDNYNNLSQTIERNGLKDRIIPVNKGVGDRIRTLKIDSKDGNSSFLPAGAGDKMEDVALTTIDLECKNKRIGIIKMDIEGFEYYAIQGALETIKRDKPVLLISIYHTGRDFFEIPPVIKNCVPEYKLNIIDTDPTSAHEKILVGYIE